MLPGPKHHPTGVCKGSVDGAVPGDVSLELRSPVVRVRLRLVAVDRTAVPEAAVDEHREARPREDNVRANEPIRGADRKVRPESMAVPVQY